MDGKSISLAFAALLAGGAAAQDWNRERPAPRDGHSYPECYCTNRGARVELGARACLRVGGRAFTARCAMSLNNPAWRFEAEGCPPEGSSAAPPSSARAARG